jgi:type I restriction-modification system DNA methylase subunit
MELWQSFYPTALFRGGAEAHTPVLIKRVLDAVVVPANIFLRNEYPTCILVLKKKATDAKHFVYRRQPTLKVKPKTYCAKRTLIKSLALSKIVPKKINTATLRH